MQQIGTGQPIWWRASQSPAPSAARSPVLKATAAKLERPSRLRHAQRQFKPALAVLSVALTTAAGALVFAGSERSERPATHALAEIEHMLDLAGYGLAQVSLTGHRFTPDSDIFDAIDLRAAPTMLSFDSRAAQDRVERLPWIERASIERVLPDRLEVRVTERTAIAVWRLGERHYLIDKTGRVLAAVAPDKAPSSLARLAGEGAPEAAAGLYRLLAAHPALERQVAVAERVGGRRWTLRLAGGSSIELPAEGEAEALAHAAQLIGALPARPSEIDLRVAARTLLRGAPVRNPEVRETERPLATGGI